jgi:hypothetical protein
MLACPRPLVARVHMINVACRQPCPAFVWTLCYVNMRLVVRMSLVTRLAGQRLCCACIVLVACRMSLLTLVRRNMLAYTDTPVQLCAYLTRGHAADAPQRQRRFYRHCTRPACIDRVSMPQHTVGCAMVPAARQYGHDTRSLMPRVQHTACAKCLSHPEKTTV